MLLLILEESHLPEKPVPVCVTVCESLCTQVCQTQCTNVEVCPYNYPGGTPCGCQIKACQDK